MAWPTLKVIPPVAVGEAELNSSNVPEVPPAAWTTGTYALNAQVSIFSGISNTTATVYQSLQNGNTNHDPASSPTWWKKIGTTYALYNGSAGGGEDTAARLVDATTHRVYESLINDNFAAVEDLASWVLVGPSNKWAMFDQSNTSQSEAERQIVVEVEIAERIDTIGLFNMDASSVTILSKVAGATVYNRTFSLAWPDSTWPFESIIQRELIVTDLPSTAGQVVTLTIDNGSATARLGNMVLGLRRDFGISLSGADSSIADYSRKEVNQWGDASLVEGAFAKKISCTVVVENALVDRVHGMLTRFRATSVLWQVSDQFTSLALFGFYRSFSVAFSYPTQSVCSLELEGLT